MKRRNAEQVYEQSVKTLSTAERLWLVERIIRELRQRDETEPPPGGFDWLAVHGIAPNLLDGVDAQDWISRTRQESDVQRESQWRKDR